MNKKLLTILFFLNTSICILLLCSCNKSNNNIQTTTNTKEQETTANNNHINNTNIDNTIKETTEAINEEITEKSTEYSYINTDKNTLETRILPPKNYERIPSEDDFLSYMRSLTLKEADSPVLLYSGEEKANQNAHIAVFDFDIGDRDLQQCADSLIRIYAEYLYAQKQYDKIAFHLTNGFLMEYPKWRDGNRINVNGNNVSWVNSTSYDDSYNNFRKYLDMVFIYAGTLSLAKESREVPIEEIKAGDMFIQGGSPGHCVMIADIAINENNDICFLLAQGYMPAQDFQILKNPLHEENPWYYLSEFQYPLITPQWSFDEGSLKRWLE